MKTTKILTVGTNAEIINYEVKNNLRGNKALYLDLLLTDSKIGEDAEVYNVYAEDLNLPLKETLARHYDLEKISVIEALNLEFRGVDFEVE